MGSVTAPPHWLLGVCGLSFVLTALSLLLLALTLESPGVHIFTYWAEDTAVTLAFSTIYTSC